MALSVFDLFKIGIGPSSSHTVGPMRAAFDFVELLQQGKLIARTARVQCELFGSLALTGRGHATDIAVLLGLSGERPDVVDPECVPSLIQRIRQSHQLHLQSRWPIPFHESTDLLFHGEITLPEHPNGMRLRAYTASGEQITKETFFSVGGGFVVRAGDTKSDKTEAELAEIPYPFTSAAELLAIGKVNGLSIAEMMRANERTWRSDAEIDAGLDRIWNVMQQCIERGCRTEGLLPGGLNVCRRASKVYRSLQSRSCAEDPFTLMDWVSLFALAVNEENAAGGRVVTAPTNGAAGVIPAVLSYYRRFLPGADDAGVRTFLLTAGAIGLLYKRNASLSAAEMGCQGEVGVACSMAAAGLAAVMGGSNEQIENAAEIGMEHNLGLTCDPIAGLVQVPCIERNTMGATKAINAARLAVLHGDGKHYVPLDRVIETMRQTGLDMQAKYKETSLGGLAVNVVNC